MYAIRSYYVFYYSSKNDISKELYVPFAQRGLFKTDIVLQQIETESLQTAKIEFLYIERRRLHNHLILIVVLEAVGVVSIPAVSGAS